VPSLPVVVESRTRGSQELDPPRPPRSGTGEHFPVSSRCPAANAPQRNLGDVGVPDSRVGIAEPLLAASRCPCPRRCLRRRCRGARDGRRRGAQERQRSAWASRVVDEGLQAQRATTTWNLPEARLKVRCRSCSCDAWRWTSCAGPRELAEYTDAECAQSRARVGRSGGSGLLECSTSSVSSRAVWVCGSAVTAIRVVTPWRPWRR
jgi:hypothetical protein